MLAKWKYLQDIQTRKNKTTTTDILKIKSQNQKCGPSLWKKKKNITIVKDNWYKSEGKGLLKHTLTHQIWLKVSEIILKAIKTKSHKIEIETHMKHPSYDKVSGKWPPR